MELLAPLVAIDPALVVALIAALVFAESAAMVGLFVPGEVALAAGGGLAALGHVPLVPFLLVCFAAAVLGQAAGYELGRRYGAVLTARLVRRPALAARLPRATALLAAHGAGVVVVSRWAGALRALVPFLAGTSRMPYARFTLANLGGAVLWIGGVAAVGWLAVRSTVVLTGWLGAVSAAVTVAVLLVGLVAWRRLDGRSLGSPRTWRRAAATALGLGAVTLLVGSAGFDDAGRALTAIDPRTLVGAVGLELVAVVSLIQVYRVTFRLSGGRLRPSEGAVVGLGAVSLTQLLPGGGVAGGLFAARRLVRAGADPVAAAATVVLVGAVTLGTLGVLVTGVVAVGAFSTPGYAWHAVAAAVVAGVMIGAVATVRTLLGRDSARRRATAWLGRRRRGAELARSLAANLETHRDLLRRPAALGPSTGWAAVKWTADLTVLALLVHAAGGQVPLLAIVLAYAVANLLNGLPLTPGGIGVVELGATGTLVAFGADPAVASVAVLGYRALAIGLPLLLALPIVGSDVRRDRRGRLELEVTA